MALFAGQGKKRAKAASLMGLAVVLVSTPFTRPANANPAKAAASPQSANTVIMKLRSTGHSISIPLPQASSEPSINDSARAAPPQMTAALRALWSNFPGKAGIAVMKGDGSWFVSYRGDEPMPQQSVSKLWVAIAVMDAVDKGKLRLEDQVTLRKSDMTLFHQPIAGLIGPNGYTTTIASLLKRAMRLNSRAAEPEAV